MEFKVVLGTKEGKSYNTVAKDEAANMLMGKKLGDSISLSSLGLKGYEGEITGGSDSSGFPMLRSVDRRGRVKVLFTKRGTGYRQKAAGVRKRKTVVGNTIYKDIAQINVKITKAGKEPIEKLLGLDASEEGEANASTPPEGEAPKE